MLDIHGSSIDPLCVFAVNLRRHQRTLARNGNVPGGYAAVESFQFVRCALLQLAVCYRTRYARVSIYSI